MNREESIEIFEVLERKLQHRFREIDDETLGAIRHAWRAISPAPNCPHIGSVMTSIKGAVSDGFQKRSKEGLRILSETLAAYPGTLSARDVALAKESIATLFPRELYVAAAGNTAEVFHRRQAPNSKFAARQFELDMAAIRVDSANKASRAIQKIHTALDEFALRKPDPEPATALLMLSWRNRLLQFWHDHWQWLLGTLLLGILGIVFS